MEITIFIANTIIAVIIAVVSYKVTVRRIEQKQNNTYSQPSDIDSKAAGPAAKE